MSAGKITTKIIWVIVIALIALLGAVLFYSREGESNGKFDAFAQCLAEKNITMYGAVWCPWCKKEKANFGKSFKYVPYVECPENTQKCLDLKIQGYPTWIFPDGNKLVGYQGLEKLSEASGCELPK